jgi:hypothetical protein
MDASSPRHHVPSGLLQNEWAGVPLGRAVVWKALVVLFWGQLFAWPFRPRTLAGAAMLVAAALIVAVPIAWLTIRVGSPVFHNPVARRLALRTDDGASGARIAYLLAASIVTGLAVLVLLLAAASAGTWLAREAPAVPAFLGRHFW